MMLYALWVPNIHAGIVICGRPLRCKSSFDDQPRSGTVMCPAFRHGATEKPFEGRSFRTMTWSRHSRRIELMTRSTYGDSQCALPRSSVSQDFCREGSKPAGGNRMSGNKDSAEAVKFMMLFQKLRDWIDNEPDGLTYIIPGCG